MNNSFYESTRRFRRRYAFTPLVAILGVMAWEFLANTLQIPVYLIPSPGRILSFMRANHTLLLHHAAVTLQEALLGLACAMAIGLAIGAVFAASKRLENTFLPYAVASQAVPIVAVAPLLVLWLGDGLISKIAMAALICVFPMVVNTTRGLQSVTEDQIRLFRAYRATRVQEFLKLRIPSSLPFLMSGVKISAALTMIGAIVAEYAGADEGLGYLITQATYRLDTVAVFAAVISAAICGLGLYYITSQVERVILRRIRLI